MSSKSLVRLLDRLDELKRSFTTNDEGRLVSLLAQLERRRFTDASSLIQFHEALLFTRAYPHSSRVLKKVESILSTYSKRIALVLNAGEDPDLFANPEISGIVGTSLTAIFSYPIARWLAERHAADVSIDFDGYEDGARLGQTLPRFVPLLDDESLVEATVLYEDWIGAAKGRKTRVLSWLIERFESLEISDKKKTELYDSLQLYIQWTPRRRGTSRTGMKLKTRAAFYHDGPLISRRDVSLVSELKTRPFSIQKLSRRDGAKMLDLIRDTSAIRYRELYGFSHGDPQNVIRADAGRGVQFFMNGVGPEKRLALRAYHSVFMVKNGVPIGYVETLSLFERMEVGFNIYYTFREGESAWLYSRILRLFRQLLGVTVFSVDPYQIGYENEEGIKSGAFWFYRKLGFRPVRTAITKMIGLEEKKIATRGSYRTSEAKLRKMSEGHMLFEFEPETPRRWDKFQVRNVGLAVAKRMGDKFRGDASGMRSASLSSVSRSLGVDTSHWSDAERCAFENLGLVLSHIRNLASWSEDEKKAVASIIRAKAGADEAKYLLLMQNHHRLRDEIIKMGRNRKVN